MKNIVADIILIIGFLLLASIYFTMGDSFLDIYEKKWGIIAQLIPYITGAVALPLIYIGYKMKGEDPLE